MTTLASTTAPREAPADPPAAERLRADIADTERLLDELGRMQVDLDIYRLWEAVRAELARKRAALAVIEAG